MKSTVYEIGTYNPPRAVGEIYASELDDVFYSTLYGELCSMFGKNAISYCRHHPTDCGFGFVLSVTECCERLGLRKFWKWYMSLSEDTRSAFDKILLNNAEEAGNVDCYFDGAYFSSMVEKHYKGE